MGFIAANSSVLNLAVTVFSDTICLGMINLEADRLSS